MSTTEAESLPVHGSITACPKCGAAKDAGSALTVTYHASPEQGRGFAGPSWPCRWTERGEHLCRRCERCGYGWCEAVLDGPPGKGATAT